jgi:hypothetical protein
MRFPKLERCSVKNARFELGRPLHRLPYDAKRRIASVSERSARAPAAPVFRA